MAETFPHLTFDPVSLHGQFQVFFRKYKTDPGMPEIIWRSQDQKILVRNL